MSRVSLDDIAQTPARFVESGGTDELFSVDPTLDTQGDGGVVPPDAQAKSIGDETCLADEAKAAEKVADEEAPIDRP